jgi:hypothetical protein
MQSPALAAFVNSTKIDRNRQTHSYLWGVPSSPRKRVGKL